MLLASVAAYEATPARVNCCTPPLFHLLGVHYSLFYHAVGARVVYPSAVFDAGAVSGHSIRPIRLDIRTHSSLVSSGYTL